MSRLSSMLDDLRWRLGLSRETPSLAQASSVSVSPEALPAQIDIMQAQVDDLGAELGFQTHDDGL